MRPRWFMGANDLMVAVLTLYASLFLLHGCDFYAELLNKDVKEEKQVLGYIKGYNPRIRNLEIFLKEESVYKGLVDGVMDKELRKAIRAFQKRCGIKESGYLNYVTEIAWRDAVKKNLTARTQKLSENKIDLHSREGVRQMQLALRNAGIEYCPVDGVMNKETRRAVRQFQRSKGLAADGVIGDKTRKELDKYLIKN